MSEERSNTYLTLPSNVSKTVYADNTISSYRTKLAQDMALDGTWEVGLTELHYPRTWKVMKKSSFMSILFFRIDGQGKLKNRMPVEGYEDTKRMFPFPFLKGLIATKEYNIELKKDKDGQDQITFLDSDGKKLPYAPTFDLVHIEVPTGNYNSLDDICQYINDHTITDFLGRESESYNPNFSGSLSNYFKAEYDKKQNRILFSTECQDVVVCLYNDELAKMFGFSLEADAKFKEIPVPQRYTCPYPQLFKAPKTLYVYSDIIDPERVGDSMSPLLRAIPIRDSYQDGSEGSGVINHTFQRVYYKKVNRNFISSVLIHMADDRGDEIKFEAGVVIAVLHFRRASI